MKKFKGIEIAISMMVFILIVAVAAIMGMLILNGTIKTSASPFLVMFTTLTLGSGVYVTAFALVRKGGYEFSVGSLLLIIGVILLLCTLKIAWYYVVISAVALLLIQFASLILLKSSYITFETTDKKPDYVPYTEKLKAENEKEQAQEVIPEIKSFKD